MNIRINKKQLLFLACLVMFMMFTVSILGGKSLFNFQVESRNYKEKLHVSTYVLSPFTIDNRGGGDYTWAEAALETWCTGAGTELDPYIINNILIDGGGIGSCIKIQDSDVHFEIKNSIFTNCGSNIYDAGISFYNTSGGQIIDNTCFENNRYGIFLNWFSQNNVILRNNISKNAFSGIYLLTLCNNNTILDNIIENNSENGIYLLLSNENIIMNNSFNENNYAGIHIYCSSNNFVKDNYITKNNNYGTVVDTDGINLGKSNVIERNNISYNGWDGLYIFNDCDENEIRENEIKYNGENGISIDTYSDKNTIHNNTLSKNFMNGIQIQSNCANNEIFNNTIRNNKFSGLNLAASSNNEIIGNEINSNKDFGLHGSFSYKNNILMNHIANNGESGIQFNLTSYSNKISQNVIENNSAGIFLDNQADNSEISHNLIRFNRGHGTFIRFNCESVNISNNKIIGNNGLGIGLDQACFFYYIHYNTINNNSGTGIFSGYNCGGSSIMKNEIENNLLNGITSHESSQIDFISNIISNNRNGIFIKKSQEMTLQDNIITNNLNNGIILLEYTSSFNTITKNIVHFNREYGIVMSLFDSLLGDTVLIYNNSFNNPAGINAFDNGTIGNWNNTLIGNYWHDYPGVDSNNDQIGDEPYLITGTATKYDYLPIWENSTDSDSFLCDPIFINDNDVGPGAKNWTWASNQWWCKGSGTFNDPYVIENLTIDGSGLGTCIEIRESNKYFVIQNCNLNNSGIGPDTDYYAAIKIRDSNNGIITRNNLSDNCHTALRLEFCENMTISQNNIANVWQGIYFRYSDNNEIFENEIEEADISLYRSHYNKILNNSIKLENLGITLSASDYNLIKGNYLSDIGYRGIYIMGDFNLINANIIKNVIGAGISSKDCQNNTFIRNIISNSANVGIHLESTCSNFVIYFNEFSQNGINAIDDGVNNLWYNTSLLIGNYWDDFQGFDLDDNGIGDTPYFISGGAGNHDFHPIWDDGINIPIFIDGDATGAGAHNWTWAINHKICTGSGTISDPYLIKEALIASGGSGNCIEIRDSNVHFRIESCDLSNSTIGIKLENVTNGKLNENNCTNGDYGIYLVSCSNIDMIGNRLTHNNLEGILVLASANIFITNNFMSYNRDGIKLYSSANNILFNNTMTNNNENGVHIREYSENNELINNNVSNNRIGYYVVESSNNSFFENNVNDNNYIGIYFHLNSNYNNVSKNTIINNLGATWGIYVYKSNFTSIENNIVGGTVGHTTAIDINLGLYSNISGNNVSNSYIGIGLRSSSFNDITSNIVENSSKGIIAHTSSYNNFFLNYVNGGDDYGIYSYNSDEISIVQNEVLNSRIGIYVTGSTISIIYRNEVFDGGHIGIYVDSSINVNLSGNLVVNNYRWGVYLLDSNHSIVIDNTISSHISGIDIAFCHFNIFSDNIINNNDNGIVLRYSSSYNEISSNIFTQNYKYGIGLALSSNNNKIINNFLTENEGYGCIVLRTCYDNFIGNNTVFNNTNHGIWIRDYSLENKIIGNIIEKNQGDGIHITHSNNTLISSNILKEITGYGIYLYNSSQTLIDNNIVKDVVGTGIYLGNTLNNDISNNLAANCTNYGLYIYLAQDCSIIYNNITENEVDGIYLQSSIECIITENIMISNGLFGVDLYYSSNNILSLNEISESNDGFYLLNSDNNVIFNNTVNLSPRYGIRVHSSVGNIIYYNFFIENQIQTYETESTGNYWYNPVILRGNYWSDYQGVDLDDNGIGDTPYLISSSIDSQDKYPIWEDGPASPPLQDSTVLTGDVNIEGGEGIVIDADGIVFDGNGFTLIGNNSGTGITIIGIENITIKNLIVVGCDIGVLIQDSLGVTIKNCTFSNSIVDECSLLNSTIYDSVLQDTEIIGSDVRNSNINDGDVQDSMIIGGMISGGTIWNSFLENLEVDNATIETDSFGGFTDSAYQCIIGDSTIEGGVYSTNNISSTSIFASELRDNIIVGSQVTDSNIQSGEIMESSVVGGLISDSIIWNSFLENLDMEAVAIGADGCVDEDACKAAIVNATALNCEVADCFTDDCIFELSVISDSIINNSNLLDTVVTGSTIQGTVILGDSNVDVSELVNCLFEEGFTENSDIVDCIIRFATSNNDSILFSNVRDSDLFDDRIVGSNISNSNIYDGDIQESSIIGGIISGGTIWNSFLESLEMEAVAIGADGCVDEDACKAAIVKASALNCEVADCFTDDCIFELSVISDSIINNSNLLDTVVTGSTIQGTVILGDSNVDVSELVSCLFEEGFTENSDIVDSIIRFATSNNDSILFSIVRDSDLFDDRIVGSQISDGKIEDSDLIDCTIESCTLANNIIINFDNALNSETTTIERDIIGPILPAGVDITGSYYEITTDATYTDMITISLPYDEFDIIGNEEDLMLGHWEESTEEWIDVTSWVDTENNAIYGIVSHFSVFAVMEQVDFVPPETELIISNCYVDEHDVIYVTEDSLFVLNAIDDLSGVALIFYRINNGDWIEFVDNFNLAGPNGDYFVEYYGIDELGNVEGIQQKTDVKLVNLEINSYLGDGDDNLITYFDLIIKDRKSNGYEIVATNPGQIFYYVEITNTWPSNINNLHLTLNIPEDFIPKGSNPIQIYLDGEDITDLSTIDGFNVSIKDIVPESSINIIVHLDYGLKGILYDTLEEIIMKGYIFSTEISAQGDYLIQSTSTHSSLTAHQKKLTAIAGYVMDINGNPLQNVVVEMYDSTGQLLGSTITDENGFFYFIDMDEGEYEVHIIYEDHTNFEIVTAYRDEMTLLLFVIPDLNL